jgi:hypothetical protein
VTINGAPLDAQLAGRYQWQVFLFLRTAAMTQERAHVVHPAV